jgi:hypothetical protein
MTSSSSIRLRLSHDAIFLPSGKGAFFRGDGDSFIMPDAGTYELMRRLAPDLSDSCSLDELCQRHPGVPRNHMVSLIEALIARGIVRRIRDPQPECALPEAVRSRFAAPLAFIEAVADAPDERFHRFRTSPVLLVGGGLSFSHCAAALVRNGLQRLWLIDLAETASSLHELHREVQALGELRIPADVYVADRAAGLTDDSCRPSLILYVADAPSLPDLARTGRRSLSACCGMIPGFLLDDQIVLGPMVRAPACYVCTFARLALGLWDRARIEALIDGRETTGGVPTTDVARASLARRLGGEVAFEAFKVLAGNLRPEIERGLTLQTQTSGGGVRATFIPCTSHGCRGGCRIVADEVDATVECAT